MGNKKMKTATDHFQRELLEIVSAIADNKALLNEFLADLFTPGEYEDIARRWQIVKQLNRGVSQRDIMKNLGVAAATVTRGARMLLNPSGGFNKVLYKI